MRIITVDRTASKGIVKGKAYIVKKQPELVSRTYIRDEEIEKEITRYEEAVEKAKQQLQKLSGTSDIFAAHLELTQDAALTEGVMAKIKDQKKNAEWALSDTSYGFLEVFDAMKDEHLRERSSDIKDVTNRLLHALAGHVDNGITSINEKVILIAEDLTPSEIAGLNLDLVLGFITEEGGLTSHVSIMAKDLNLPALVGVSSILSKLTMNDEIIMDAEQGIIIINPDSKTLEQYKVLEQEYQYHQEELSKGNQLNAITLDGRKFTLTANVGSIEDIKQAIRCHADGVGLFRSEFLYMESPYFPLEEEQFLVYKEAAELLEGKEIIVRTLDIGGDKELSYDKLPKEENPFLGYRAIRISLDKVDVFKTQLRALLRASYYGNIKIMYPMIISLEELEKANQILESCKCELKAESIPYNSKIQVGMMVETPAAVMCIDDFANKVDFLSIGTNDLTQYTLTVDRGNKKISHLFNSFHPAVLRSIKKVIDAGHNNHIKVGMCGEFASNPKALKLLMGMGLDEFSMSPGVIAKVKYELRKTEYEKAKNMANQMVTLSRLEDINHLLDHF